MKAYLEMGEIERTENAAIFVRDRLLLRLLARVSCKVDEVLALEVNGIDFVNGTVTI